MVLDDILLSDQTEKFKVLKPNQEYNHSAYSHQPSDRCYLECLVKKDPIAWPKMNESEKWSQLDDGTIQERVALLEKSIYNKASLLYGHLPPPKKA